MEVKGGMTLILLAVWLGLTTRVPGAVGCDRILVHGHAFWGTDNSMLGFYHQQPYSYAGYTVWKHTDSDLHFWVYNNNWVLGNTVGSLDHYVAFVQAYSSTKNHPGQPVNSQWVIGDNWNYNSNWRVECEETRPAYLFRLGYCPGHAHDIANLVQYIIDQSTCEGLCESDDSCVGYTYSKDGCFPKTESCSFVETDLIYLRFEYTRGQVSDFVLGAVTLQSSTHSDWQEGSADRAVDGSLEDRMLYSPYCTHTSREVQPWWAVELPPALQVTAVIIKNRADCCGDRLRNINILIGISGTLADNQANLNSRVFNEILCKHVDEISGGRVMVTCERALLGTYVVITFDDTVAENILTLCEVEIAGQSIDGQYFVDTTGTSGNEADADCNAVFGGQAVRLSDRHEWDSVLSFIQGELGAGHACLDKRKSGTRVGNRVGTGEYIGPVAYGGSPQPGWNVAQESQQAECVASSELSYSTDCYKALDETPSTAWKSYNEGAGAWMKITLRYSYPISIIALTQTSNANFDLLTLDFENGEFFDDFYMPEDTDEWATYYLSPTVMSRYVIITGIDVRISGANGFQDVRVYAQEPVGYALRDGDCSGNTVRVITGDIIFCQNECTSDSACAGYVHEQDSSTCWVKSTVCSESDTVTDANKVIIYKTDYDGGTFRYGDCWGSDLYGTSTTPGECYARCAAARDCRNYLWMADGTCWTKYRNCDVTSYTTSQFNFDMVTPRSPGVNYMNCYSGASVLSGPSTEPIADNTACIQHCDGSGYTYAGTDTEGQDRCTCGNQVTGHKAVGYGRTCNQWCSTNQDHCGGGASTSVYSTQALDYSCLHVVDDRGVAMWVAGPCAEGMCVVCERDYDNCVSDPCLNQGACANYELYFNCTCASGFYGDVCEHEVDECESAPCMNGGSCQDAADGYTCHCVLGYMGDMCETDYDECSELPCLNNGTCSEGDIGTYLCACPDAYSGNTCELEVNECDSNPCQHGGACSDHLDYYSCSCEVGYTGYECQTNIDECASSPCLNGSTCVDGVNSYTCECVDGFSGVHCGLDVDECASTPCQNGATCEELMTTYVCHCAPGFTGTVCETNINTCLSHPCMNHVRCVDLVGGFRCECLPGYEGTLCEIYIGNPGEWTEWGNWTDCSMTCNDGVLYRMRDCIPQFIELGAGNCNGPEQESLSCYLMTCPPVNGSWGEWRPAGACSVSCGPGIVRQRRECDSPSPQHGGAPCPEAEFEKYGLCSGPPCLLYRYCEEWTDWSECDQACGGKQSRDRKCFTRPLEELNGLNKTAEVHITDSQERYCPCDSGVSCQVCDLSMPLGASTIPSCPQGGQQCSSDQEYCGYIYSKNSGTLSLSKRCMSQTECDTAVTSQETKQCRRLMALTGTYSNIDTQASSVVDEVMQDDVVGRWSHLEETCSLCCKGHLCNEGLLPGEDTLNEPEHSDMATLKAPIIYIILLLLLEMTVI